MNRLPIWNSQNCSIFPLAFVAGWLQGHWWGFISRNYVVWPTFFLMNVFIALKGSHFWFYIQNIPYKYLVTNEEVCNRIQNPTGVHDDLTMVKKRKLRWYGHIARSSGMAKTILQGTVKGARMRRRQKKRWEDNIKEWTGMGFGNFPRTAEDTKGWKGIAATPSVVLRWPPRLRDWDEMRWHIYIRKTEDVCFPLVDWRRVNWLCNSDWTLRLKPYCCTRCNSMSS